jgi:hypothetical protein
LKELQSHISVVSTQGRNITAHSNGRDGQKIQMASAVQTARLAKQNVRAEVAISHSPL